MIAKRTRGKRTRFNRFAAFAALALAATSLWAAATVKRAKPPHWNRSASDAFFTDAREKLQGERPAHGGLAAPADPGRPADEPGGGGGGTFTWSKLIEPDTVEDEIKSLQKQFSETITTPAPFKGGGAKTARRQLTELAVLFAIIAEYDGDVRWKKDAVNMRELIGRTGMNCKVGTDASFNEAKLRKDELETLVRGGASPSVAGADPKVAWEKIAGRPPLMQRLEALQQQGIAVYTANAADFNKNLDKALKEAELIAAIAEVIQRPGFEFTDDDQYLNFAKAMRDAALTIVDAAKSKNYDAARAASGKIDKACSQCHEGYRS